MQAPEKLFQALRSSQVGIKYAAAVAEVRRKNPSPGGLFSTTGADLGEDVLRGITTNYARDRISYGKFVPSFFQSMPNLTVEGADIAGLLGWIVAACGAATGKKVRVHVHVGEIPESGPVQRNPDFQASLEVMKTHDALLFVNYTFNAGNPLASFAIAKPKGMLSTDVDPHVEWTVFCPLQYAAAGGRFTRILKHFVGSGPNGVSVLHMNSTYDSLEALVTDIIAHLMFNGRPAANALWSGNEIRKGLALAGLFELGGGRTAATITMLNAAVAAKSKRVPPFVNGGAPPDLPPHLSDSEYMAMYSPMPGTNPGDGEGAVPVKRKNETVWATSAAKAVKNLEKVQGASGWLRSGTTYNWLAAFHDKTETNRVGRDGKAEDWTTQSALKDMANAVLGMSMNITVKENASIPRNVQDVWNALSIQMNNFYGGLGGKEDVFSKDLKVLVGDIISGTFFYALFLYFVDQTKPMPSKTFFTSQSLDVFLPYVVMFCVDQFVDFTMAETWLMQNLAGQTQNVTNPPAAPGLSFILLSAANFVSENKSSFGVEVANAFQSLDGLFNNPNEMSHVVARNVLRAVTVSALLNFLAVQAKDDAPLFEMSWPPSRMPGLVSRIVHFFRPNKINAGRRGTTAAAAALDVLYVFMKQKTPSLASINEQIDLEKERRDPMTQKDRESPDGIWSPKDPQPPLVSPGRADGRPESPWTPTDARQPPPEDLLSLLLTPQQQSDQLQGNVVSSPWSRTVEYKASDREFPSNLAQELISVSPLVSVGTPSDGTSVDKAKKEEIRTKLSNIIGSLGDAEVLLLEYQRILETDDSNIVQFVKNLRSTKKTVLDTQVLRFQDNLDELENIEKLLE